MVKTKCLAWALSAAAGFLLVGCDSAKTTIVEKDPIVGDDDDHKHDHEGSGRLVVIHASGLEA